MSRFELASDGGTTPDSPARTRPAERGELRVGVVQTRWHPDPDEHRAALAEGTAVAAADGAELICHQELTLSPYFALLPDEPAALDVEPETLPGGPTHTFATGLADEHGVVVHASLYEAPGWNTAIAVAPGGDLLARTRKVHIPVTAGYHEDRYFTPGDTGYPVVRVGPAHVGFPTCWDEWFSEPARIYSLAGADLLVYPTAIGSEPDHPAFDTAPLLRQVVIGNGIANGLAMVVANRYGTERLGDVAVTFYGSSFISDCYGRVLAAAPQDRDCVLVASIDLDARRDWLELFPFLTTRRPDTYDALVAPTDDRTDDATGAAGDLSDGPRTTGTDRPTGGRPSGAGGTGSGGA